MQTGKLASIMGRTRGPIIVILLALVGCSDPVAEEQARELDTARAALDAGEPEQALFHAKSAWDPQAPDPEVALVAAAASLELNRPADAIRYVETVLTVNADLSAELTADLSWARGMGYARRYFELKNEDDWREANRSLEEGTLGGSHRIESATYLAAIQVMGAHNNAKRARRYADIVLTEAPDSKHADTMRKLLERLDADS